MYCSLLSMHRSSLPVRACDRVAVSHVKVKATQRENHFPDFLFAKQHCHLVLNRDRPAYSRSCTLKTVKMRAGGLKIVHL